MYNQLKRWFLRRIYKLLIFKTIVVDKSYLVNYERLDTFCELTMETDKGSFRFLFKRDYKEMLKNDEVIPSINNYIVELIIPEGLILSNDTIKNKIVIVIKILLFKPNYEIFTELLYDSYLDCILEYINQQKNV